jgi:hypothetical protein
MLGAALTIKTPSSLAGQGRCRHDDRLILRRYEALPLTVTR